MVAQCTTCSTTQGPGCTEPGSLGWFQASTAIGYGTKSGTMNPKKAWHGVPALLTSCGALDTFLNLSEPSFIHNSHKLG